MPDRSEGLAAAAAQAERFLSSLDERPVVAQVDANAIQDAPRRGPVGARRGPRHGDRRARGGRRPGHRGLGGPAPLRLRHRRRAARRAGRRRLVSAWDQCAAFHSLSPAAAAIEEIAAEWVLDLMGLPASASVGFVTGGQGANTACLAAARHAVLARAGWDVERGGLAGGPRVNVVWRAGARHDLRPYAVGARLRGGADGRCRRPGADAERRAREGAGATSTARRSSALRPATSRPGASIPSARSPTPAGAQRLAHWTAPSGCGRGRPRPHAGSWKASSVRTRGQSTRTSGRTCPTTARWRSWRTRACTTPQ